MSNNSQHQVTVTLLDRKYDIVCPPEQVKALHEAARYLDQIMRQTKQSSNIISQERIAIISALNIAHELLAVKKDNEATVQQMSERITTLQERIEQTLSNEL